MILENTIIVQYVVVNGHVNRVIPAVMRAKRSHPEKIKPYKLRRFIVK